MFEKGKKMLKDLVMKNRTCRGYDENYEVSRDELVDMIEHARFCGTGANKQPLRFHLVYDKETAKEVVKATTWAAALKELELPKPNMYPTSFIIICQDLEIYPNKNACGIDVGIAAQTILLSATEKELAGCMIALFNPDEIAKLLQIDTEKYLVKLVIAIGKSNEKIVLTDIGIDEPTDYYRNIENTHFVPKRLTKDIVIN